MLFGWYVYHILLDKNEIITFYKIHLAKTAPDGLLEYKIS
jgi:hypothetical protein